ncbi:MAG TPA: beta-propeller fold lactonase family protein, partial [Pirellulales bacterium]|nr:beta-propeller fold lactonase family protein [Pirellulales bacterium]
MNRATLAVTGLVLTGLAIMIAPARGQDARPAAAGTWLVYVGTYTGEKSKGIYACRLDLASGQCTMPVLAAEAKSPSFLALHPNGKFLYAVNEISDFEGKPTGGVSGFAIDRQSLKLMPLNHQASGGAGPCHLTVDKTGHSVLVANYGGGSVAALPVGEDGRLSPAAIVIQHHGHSVDRARQEAPHAHSI